MEREKILAYYTLDSNLEVKGYEGVYLHCDFNIFTNYLGELLVREDKDELAPYDAHPNKYNLIFTLYLRKAGDYCLTFKKGDAVNLLTKLIGKTARINVRDCSDYFDYLGKLKNDKESVASYELTTNQGIGLMSKAGSELRRGLVSTIKNRISRGKAVTDYFPLALPPGEGRLYWRDWFALPVKKPELKQKRLL